MLNMERSYIRNEIVDGAGNPVVLVTERLMIGLGASRAGIGAAYERPLRIEHDGSIVPIADLVMITKLVGLLFVLMAMIVRTVRQ